MTINSFIFHVTINTIISRYVMSRMMMYQIAALTVQSVWKIHQFNKRRAMGKLIVTNHISIADVNDRSALSIQSCWRSFCSRRIFKYFSDLIRLKLKGAPAELLRSIIPGESGLLDFASGIVQYYIYTVKSNDMKYHTLIRYEDITIAKLFQQIDREIPL